MNMLRRLLRPIRDRCDRGALEIELIGMTILLIGVVYVIVYAGRIGLALLAVQDAATQAGRAASSARTAGEASSAADGVVADTISSGWAQCEPTLSMDTSAFATTPGTPAQVTGTLRCVVDMHDLAVAGIPSSVTLTRDFSSPLDTYRERQ